MSRREILRQAIHEWMEFWYFRPSVAQLAVMRILVGAIVLYVFLLHTLDLEAHYARGGWTGGESLHFLDSMAWPFSPLQWFHGVIWLYGVHALAILVAMAFLLGIVPWVSGPLTLVFNLAYAHANPSIVLGIDAVVNLALLYLSLTPCARTLSLLDLRPPSERPPRRRPPGAPEGLAWGGVALLSLQIHLCILYFISGLQLLSADWLSGHMLVVPRVLDLKTMLTQGIVLVPPTWMHALAFAVALFNLYYGVLVWLPAFRYAVLAVALAMHAGLGFGWQLVPFNLLMLALNMAFIRPAHADLTMHGAAALLGLRWRMPED